MPAKSDAFKGFQRPIEPLSRSASYKRKGKWAVKNKKPVAKVTAPKSVITKTLANGSQRTIREKTPRWYPADDIKQPLPSRKSHRRTVVLRESLEHNEGKIVILLSGRHRGKRVVFLKKLTSGLLLVTGPYKINGVPLRRVNPAYVIATSMKVTLPDLKLDKFDDAYFKKPKGDRKKKTEAEFFAEPEKKPVIDQARSDDQKAVDAAVLPAVKAVADLPQYLSARFSLKDGDRPHDMTF